MSGDFTEAREPKLLAAELIEAYHPHLASARMEYLFTDGRMMSKGKEVWGKAQVTGGVLTHFARADFVLTFNARVWASLNETQRRALVDHELHHCRGEEDPHGAMHWSIVGHDVEEFSAVIEHYGMWRVELIEAEAAMRKAVQAELPFAEGNGEGAAAQRAPQAEVVAA